MKTIDSFFEPYLAIPRQRASSLFAARIQQKAAMPSIREKPLGLQAAAAAPTDEEPLVAVPQVIYGYQVTLNIGTPPVAYAVLLDSGSCQLWVKSLGITSTTIRSTGKIAAPLTYYDGSTVSGNLVQDTVTFANVTLDALEFEFATDVNDVALEGIDGILGLCHSPPEGMSPMFTDVATQRGQLDHKLFSVNADVITLGFVDPTYEKNVSYMPVSASSMYWQGTLVDVDATDFTGSSWKGSLPAIFDTGTSMLVLPSSIVESLASGMGYTQQNDGFYRGNCLNGANANAKTLNLTFSGMVLSLDMYQLMYQDTSSSCILCVAPDSNDQVIIGNVVLRHFYTVYDGEHDRIGFAALNESTGQVTPDGIPSSDPTGQWIPSPLELFLVAFAVGAGCIFLGWMLMRLVCRR